jgi:hypothetical protein
MGSKNAKGNTHELEVKKYLEAKGWTVFRQHRKPLWINGRIITIGADIFGCDLIAKKKSELTRWIQVGADGAKSKKEDQLNEFPWDTTHETVEIWLRLKKRKAYRIYLLQPVDSNDPGRGQSFVDRGIVEVGYSLSKASGRLLPGGASFIR